MSFASVDNTVVAGLASGSIYALIGMGFSVTSASTGVLNFAQGDLFMVGAMIGVFFLATGAPVVVALIAAVITGAVFGIITEVLAVRPAVRKGRGVHGWVLSTLGVSIVLEAAFTITMGPDIRSFPAFFSENVVSAGPVRASPEYFLLIGVAIGVAALLWLFYKHTATGVVLLAIEQDREAAQMRGIPVARFAVLAFALSSGIAALAGFMAGPLTLAYPTVGAVYTFKGFIAAAIAGLGRVEGALLGGLLLGLIEQIVAQYINPGYQDAVTFGLLIVLLATRPNGLLGPRGLRAV
jgi:branched-chain amino acid transport system permease protein